jgi:aryl-alcohol dehydrogenase-like predicted oxidoreductase
LPDNGEAFGASEALLGQGAGRFAPALAQRMVIATKGGIIPGVPYDSSAAYLERAIDASLPAPGCRSAWRCGRSTVPTC